jgi:hypothetical protein
MEKIEDKSTKELCRKENLEGNYSHFVVHVKQVHDLPVSGIPTATLVCHAWLGDKDEKNPDWSTVNENSADEMRIKTFAFLGADVDPARGKKLIFPLRASEIVQLETLKCVVCVRNGNGTENCNLIHNHELSMLGFSLEELLTSGIRFSRSIETLFSSNVLQKSVEMEGIGRILELEFSIEFCADDVPELVKQLSREEKDITLDLVEVNYWLQWRSKKKRSGCTN